MTLQEVMTQLEAFGNPSTKRTLEKHGAKEPHFGVKVADLKKIVKKVKKDHKLSLKLYATGNSDAMYLAGLIADETQITAKILDEWADQAYWYYLNEFTVPWVAAETSFGWKLGNKWIKSKKPHIAAAGWATLANYATVTADEDLDIPAYRALLESIPAQIHNAPNRVGYVMNGFVIAVGSYIAELTEEAKTIGAEIGKVKVEMNGTACKVPLIVPYIQKVIDKDNVGK
ncbi:MAG: DNA alkylation repair protein, partial [Saprospiraceae bacterium]